MATVVLHSRCSVCGGFGCIDPTFGAQPYKRGDSWPICEVCNGTGWIAEPIPVPRLLPVPHPNEDKCGHGFPIAFCSFERCVARKLYEALKEQREWTTGGPCQKGVIDRDGRGVCRCETCKNERADAALRLAKGEKV